MCIVSFSSLQYLYWCAQNSIKPPLVFGLYTKKHIFKWIKKLKKSSAHTISYLCGSSAHMALIVTSQRILINPSV